MSAIRIKPSMQFQSPFVGFANPKFQRIVKWHGRHPLIAGQIIRPRLQRAQIQRIALRANLKNNRVHIQRFDAVENGNRFLPLYFWRESRFTGPIDIRHSCDPNRPEFPGNLGNIRRNFNRSGFAGCAGCQKNSEKKQAELPDLQISHGAPKLLIVIGKQVQQFQKKDNRLAADFRG